MNKKLMAVAVAGALAVPGVALAQSSVTISGYFKGGYDAIRLSGQTSLTTAQLANVAATVGTGNPAPVTRTSASESRVTDHSSRILFNVTEDLGGGLQAIGQMDMRFTVESTPQPTNLGYAGSVGGGNTWVGLRSKTWGTLTFGKHDLHYGKAGDDTAAKAGSLLLIADSLFSSVQRPTQATAAGTATAQAGTSGQSMAGQTRTNGVIRYDTPTFMNVLSATFAWSSNPLQTGGGGSNTEGDLHTSATGVTGTGPQLGNTIRRKGNGWNINPKLTGATWFAEYSYWRAKQDTNNSGSLGFTPAVGQTGAAGITAGAVGRQVLQDDQRSDTIAGNMRFGGFKLGLAWNRSKTTTIANGLVSGDRTAWSIPLSYTWGRHSVAGHYTKASDSKNTGLNLSGAQTGASMWAIAYDYSLSKRTFIGASYGQLSNRSSAQYSMFYNASTAFGSNNSAALPGEDTKLFSAVVRHNF